MPLPLVSIIVPCYNHGRYLSDALLSIRRQTYQKWEGIIINDGSNDNTEKVALQCCNDDPRFRYVSQNNCGVSRARNRGVKESSGSFIQFLDADDILVESKVAHQADILQSFTDIDVIYGLSRYFFDGHLSNLYPMHYNGGISAYVLHRQDALQKEAIFKYNPCTICASMYRRHIFNSVEFTDSVFEDWLFHIECALRGYVFHFDGSIDSYSLIRMTDQSQMMEHINRNCRTNEFERNVRSLASRFKFESRLSAAHFQESTPRLKRIAKRIVGELVPPIFRRLF